MQTEIFRRVLDLVSKTGERHIVIDASLSQPVVLLPLDAYEQLTTSGASEHGPRTIPLRQERDHAFAAEVPVPEPVKDAIDRDVELWQQVAEDDVAGDLGDVTTIDNDEVDEEKFYLEPIE